MIRDAERSVDVECRSWLGRALDGFEYVPSDIADHALGPLPETPELAGPKREAEILVADIGRLQTGRPVNKGWAFDYLRSLGLDVLGVDQWRLDGEDNLAAVLAVVAEARNRAAILRVGRTEEELARLGAPF